MLHKSIAIAIESSANRFLHRSILEKAKPRIALPSFSSMIDFRERNRLRDIKVDDAIDLFSEMVKSRPFPSIVDFNRLLIAIVKSNKFDDVVISLGKKMELLGIGNDVYTLNILINCCSSSSCVQLSVLGKMLKLGYEPDKFTIGSIVYGLCRRNRVSDAVSFVEKMVELGYKPDIVAYNSIIDCLCKTKRLNDALSIFRGIDNKGVIRPNVVTYTSLVKGLCNSGRWTDAARLLSDMIKRKISPNVITYTSLVDDAFVKNGKVLEAKELYEEMIRMNIDPNAQSH